MVFRIVLIVTGCLIAGYALSTEGTQLTEALIGGMLIGLGVTRP